MVRTQGGNNNAYCQDNEISWQRWEWTAEERRFLSFVRELIGIRKRHPLLRRRDYFRGRPIRGASIKDLSWLRPDGGEMSDEEWNDGTMQCIGLLMAGDAGLTDELGRSVIDDTLVMLMNSGGETCNFCLPAAAAGTNWSVVLDTARPGGENAGRHYRGRANYPLSDRSLALLRRPTPREQSRTSRKTSRPRD